MSVLVAPAGGDGAEVEREEGAAGGDEAGGGADQRREGAQQDGRLKVLHAERLFRFGRLDRRALFALLALLALGLQPDRPLTHTHTHTHIVISWSAGPHFVCLFFRLLSMEIVRAAKLTSSMPPMKSMRSSMRCSTSPSTSVAAATSTTAMRCSNSSDLFIVGVRPTSECLVPASRRLFLKERHAHPPPDRVPLFLPPFPRPFLCLYIQLDSPFFKKRKRK